MPIFELKDIRYKYDKYDNSLEHALNGVTFSIYENDILALVGESGSGKSTLISHLNGLYKSDSGDIFFKGQSIYDNKFDLTNLRFKCGIVFQYPEYQLFSESVIEDVAYGAIKKGFSKEEAFDKAIETLKLLNIEHLKDEMPLNLSGGEKRKVAFAGVIVMEPEVLILDEPDAGLDPIAKKDFYNFVKKLNEKNGTTVIFITHNLDDVIEYANNVVVLHKGKVLAYGKPYDILSNGEIMNKANLEMPYAVEIYNELRNKGYYINKTKLKFNEIINSLKELK